MPDTAERAYMNDTEKQAVTLLKSVAIRFAKGGLSGAGAALAVISIQAPATWSDLSTVLIALTYAIATGFLTGGILAVEKWYNWTNTPAG